MAVNIFEKYGIKEVANVYFEALENDSKAGVYKGDIVLFLDTLKVSTIETTAENVAAQGGWGNPRLISWDYGKEINITLEDALMSIESLRFMMGGSIREAKKGSGEKIWVKHTVQTTLGENGVINIGPDRFNLSHSPAAHPDRPIKVINLTRGTRTQIPYSESELCKIEQGVPTYIKFVNPKRSGIVLANDENDFNAAADKHGWGHAGDVVRFFWEEEKQGANTGTDFGAVEVTISPSTFPGTYRVVGDTFMRNTNGKDEPFQFVIEKAKVQSDVTLTLEAEGDPTTFEMTLQVLRADSGDEMMKLVRYGTEADREENDKDEGSLTSDSSKYEFFALDAEDASSTDAEPGTQGGNGNSTNPTGT